MGLAPYDSADYLYDEQDFTAYLQAVMAEDSEDPAYLARALVVVARARSMSQLARDTGLTREGVRKALAPGGNPSYATVAKVAKALGFRLTLAPVGEVLGKSQDITP
ncbi:MAG: putative addiction module antidote protein [Burkholderiales bacterium]|nr:putative addiction module antidote protein [Burkholderiales bacterium]